MPVPPLRVAMLSIHSCPAGRLGTKDTGGMSVYIREVAAVMGQLGHQVDIFTRTHDMDHLEIMPLSQNVRLIHLAAGDPADLSKLSVYPHVLEYAEKLAAFAQKNGITYDVIHSHYWLSGLVGRILAQMLPAAHVIMFHTLGRVKNELNTGPLEPPVRLENESRLVKAVDRIVAPTDTEKNYLTSLLDAPVDKIVIIPCGVNQTLFAPVPREEARTALRLPLNERLILYVGRIEPLKGLDLILDALAWLSKTFPVKLAIAGGDDPGSAEMQAVYEKIAADHLEGAVFFAGRVDQQHLPLYYCAADVLAVASRYESFGLVALEALSCGTPVVSTPVGGMASVIQQGKTGFVTAAQGYAQALENVLDQAGRFEKQQMAISRSVAHLSWERIGRAVLDVYAGLVHGRRVQDSSFSYQRTVD